MPKRGGVNFLTPKQETFCREYVQNNGNALDAARKAGYSVETKPTAKTKARPFANGMVSNGNAAGLLRNEGIKKRIRALEEEQGVYANVTKEWIIFNFRIVYAKAMTRTQWVGIGKQAREVADPDLQAANRALENMGRHLAMFVDKTESKNETTINFKGMMRQEIIIEEILSDEQFLSITPTGIVAAAHDEDSSTDTQ
jgi:hypothetical protein